MRARFTRFERRIFAALVLVAVASLVGGYFVGRAALRDAYAVGVNPRVHGELESALEVYRAHLELLRRAAKNSATLVATDPRVHAAIASGERGEIEALFEELLTEYPEIGAIEVPRLARAARDARVDPETHRTMTVEESLGAGEDLIRVTIAAPRALFEEYQVLGEETALFARLVERREFVASVYLGIYFGVLGFFVLGSLILALILSRRVTRRVAALSRATRQVGRGDLSVSVPAVGDDEIEELTEAFNTMVRDLRHSQTRIEYLQRIGAWQEFARRLAHEIKNPLTPIQLAVQEVEAGYRGDDPRFRRTLEEARGIVEEEVAALRRMVGEFSRFARLPRAALTEADFSEVLGELERSVPALLEDVGDETLRVEVEGCDDPLPVEVDAMMFKRALDNLVRNALEALRDGGGSTVHVRARRAGELARVEVSDDGPGVDPQIASSLFDPYVTKREHGTGLGLAIAKKVVLEHGGTLELAESADGALFVIELPLRLPTD